MAANIFCVDKFDPTGDPSSVSSRWTRWKKSFELYIAARGDVGNNQKRPLLLHCAGVEVQNIFDTLDGGASYDEAITALDTYFKPLQNETFERHQFRQMTQKAGETTAQFVTRLRQKAENCNFGAARDASIRDQVIDRCPDRTLQAKLLAKRALTLGQLLEKAQAHEAAVSQVKQMDGRPSEKETELVSAVSRPRPRKPFDRTDRKTKTVRQTRTEMFSVWKDRTFCKRRGMSRKR